MSDFPQAHTTTTTTTQHTATITTGRIQLDVAYIKTIPGILRIVEIVLCIILFICAVSACSGWYIYGRGNCGFASFVAFMGFIFVIGWLLFYLFHVHDSAPNVPWLLIELIFYAVWTFFLVISGIVLAVLSADTYGLIYYQYAGTTHASAGAGAFFAFAAAIAFGFQTFLLFQAWRAHRIANPRQPMAGHP